MKFYVLHSQHDGETTIAEYEDEGELYRWLDRWQLGNTRGEFPPRVNLVSSIQDFEMDGGTAIIFRGDIHMPFDQTTPEEKPTKSQLQKQDVYFTFTYSEDGVCMRVHLTKDALLKEIEEFKRDQEESADERFEGKDLFVGDPEEGEYFVDGDNMLIIKGRIIVPQPKEVVRQFEVD